MTGRRALVAVGAVALAAWGATTAWKDREALQLSPQVWPEMLQVRTWTSELPKDATIRIDVPASGLQLWIAYLTAARPTNTRDPVLFTTYAHPPSGSRADYSIAPADAPRPRGTVDPPVRRNADWVLRRIVIPPQFAKIVPYTASQKAIQPYEREYPPPSARPQRPRRR